VGSGAAAGSEEAATGVELLAGAEGPTAAGGAPVCETSYEVTVTVEAVPEGPVTTFSVVSVVVDTSDCVTVDV
jgi:hypothetical protein